MIVFTGVFALILITAFMIIWYSSFIIDITQDEILDKREFINRVLIIPYFIDKYRDLD